MTTKWFRLGLNRTAFRIAIITPVVFLTFTFMYINTDKSVKDLHLADPNKSLKNTNKSSEINLTTSTEPLIPSTFLSQEKKPVSFENPFLGREAKARLIQISNDFSDDIQYPDNSKPIRNSDELKKYTPNQSIASNIPTNVADENSPRIWLKTSKHQYFLGETIFAEAGVEGLKSHQNINITGRIIYNGETLATTTALPSQQETNRFTLSFDNIKTNIDNGFISIRVVAKFNIENKYYEIGSPINLTTPIANIDYVGPSSIFNEYLHIPVYITASNPGYHLISANLYNEADNRALVHISEQKELIAKQDFITLKVHIAALMASKDEGPYKLMDLTLTRMPSKPNYQTEYGTVPETSYPVSGYSFSDYKQTAYYDENTQASKDFLNQLGGK